MNNKRKLLSLANNCPNDKLALEKGQMFINYSCGDILFVHRENNSYFIHTKSCVLCKASISYVLNKINSLDQEKQKHFFICYRKFILTGEKNPFPKDSFFNSIYMYPNRYNCVLLIIDALERIQIEK
jgi:hypothetical protein